jgi:beta-carotene 3-hydroxylase
MELVAYLSHRYIMHGPLWFLHESHHKPHDGGFEWNDLFGFFFALPAIVLIWFGTHGHPRLLWMGLGITAYGIAYFGFHDIIVHRRLPVKFNPRSGYLRHIIKAHLVHHRTLVKQGAESFGFLYAPSLEDLKTKGQGAPQD